MDIYAAGAVAAFTVDILVYPLDTLKTRYQSQDYLKAYGSGSSYRALAPRGLYQGIGSVVLATLPAAGLFFSTYEKAKIVIGETLPIHKSLVHSSASATAEVVSCLVLAPAEVIKQNAQMLRQDSSRKSNANSSSGRLGPSSSSSTSLRAFRQLAGREAPRRLFTGYTALVARNLPFTALQFPVFENFRGRLWKARLDGREDKTRGIAETGIIAGGSAGTAGAFAAFITTPSDVVKTRMMLMAGSQGMGGGSDSNKSAETTKINSWGVTKQIYGERRVVGFFRGGLFRSAWTALGSSLYLGTYDAAKLWLARRKSETDEAVDL